MSVEDLGGLAVQPPALAVGAGLDAARPAAAGPVLCGVVAGEAQGEREGAAGDGEGAGEASGGEAREVRGALGGTAEGGEERGGEDAGGEERGGGEGAAGLLAGEDEFRGAVVGGAQGDVAEGGGQPGPQLGVVPLGGGGGHGVLVRPGPFGEQVPQGAAELPLLLGERGGERGAFGGVHGAPSVSDGPSC